MDHGQSVYLIRFYLVGDTVRRFDDLTDNVSVAARLHVMELAGESSAGHWKCMISNHAVPE
jgi:hypothetical protein